MKNIFLFILICSSNHLFSKVRVLTFHCNRPDFVEIQHKLFTKFLIDDFEIIVFNDAKTEEMEEQIRHMCDKCGIQCVRFKQEWHKTDPLNTYLKTCLNNPRVFNHMSFVGPTLDEAIANQPSVRHCHVIQYALDNYGYHHDDAVVICDGDAFPIRLLSVETLLERYDIVSTRQHIWKNIDYLWVVFVAFNPTKLPDPETLKFHLDVIANGLYDSGSNSHYYCNEHPLLKIRKYFTQKSSDLNDLHVSALQFQGFSPQEIRFIKTLPKSLCVDFFTDLCLLHYGASSWESDQHLLKTEHVLQFVSEI